MVRLNKNVLPEDQLHKLFTQLNNTVAKQTAEGADDFMRELLGYEERIMLAKRLAVIVLLLEGQSLYRISRILKISTATAEKISRKLTAGDYDNMIKMLKKSKKNYASILETLEWIMHGGGIMPRRYGLDRYKFVR